MPLIEGDVASVILNERTVTLIAEAAADRAAKRSVRDVFFLLGIDVENESHVRAISEAMHDMHDRFHSRREHQTEARRAFYGVVGTLFISVFSSVFTLFATGHLHFDFWSGR